MATHAIGKLKFNLSDQGLAFRWGEGDVHRLFQGRKKGEESDYTGDYQDSDFDDAAAYDDGYADQADYADGDDQYYDDGYDDGQYTDDGYDDGQYTDDGYDDDGGQYADDGYDDGGQYADDGYDDDGRYADDDQYTDDGYDDQYDDGYTDDRYADGDYYDDDGYDGSGYDEDYAEGEYDDRYSDMDAGEDYGEGGEYYGEQSPLMQYVDENDWVTYLLLFLLPPLGIYLLWRRNKFEQPIRWAVSAASALWFIVALVLIFSLIFRGSGDRTAQPIVTLAPQTATPTVAAIEAPEATEEAESSSSSSALLPAIDQTVAPTAIPSSGGSSTSTGSTGTLEYVYSPATGAYYHSREDCPNIEQGASLSRIAKAVAESSRRQTPCPECIGIGSTTLYWGRHDGSYYHSDQNCSNMKNAIQLTEEAWKNENKTACPVCVTKTKSTLDEGTMKLQFVNEGTVDQSNMKVYCTEKGTWFHVKSNCRDMKNAKQVSLKDALLAGKTACPTCCPTAASMVYCTRRGVSYHLDEHCQKMSGAKQVTLAEAMVMGKKKCDVCIKGSVSSSSSANSSSSSAAASSSGSSETKGSEAEFVAGGGTTYVYGTKDGKYYHTNSTCGGMKNAQRYTLKSMLLAKRPACPTCASSANTTVYATNGGKYYHSYATCSDIKNANSGTLAQALASGYRRCPKCWTGKTSARSTSTATTTTASKTTGTSTTTVSASAATARNTYVYATKDGAYYHIKSNCTGMKNGTRVTLKAAVDAGKTPCPTCASAAKRVVYSHSNGKYYHSASECPATGMKGAEKRTLQEALMLNQTACPQCTGKNAPTATATSTSDDDKTTTVKATYKSGTSGVKVYATRTSKHYHKNSTCSGMTGAAHISLETALNYGKTACPTCLGSADRVVYATRGGKYYHYSKADAGSGAKRGQLDEALAYGYEPCPYCVSRVRNATAAKSAATSTTTVTETYKSGTSGIKVYAIRSGKYYHGKPSCSGMTNAAYITLETALNYGKSACPVCLASASRKVYSNSGDRYYHYSKAHAGSGAKAGTLAEAKAYGLKACPTCTAAVKAAAAAAKKEKESAEENEKKKAAKALAAALRKAQKEAEEKAKGKEEKAKDNGSDKDAPVSTVEYSASSDAKVYINAGSVNNYYHKSATCKPAKFSGGTKVTMQYVVDWGYKACPYCNPPTSIGITA